LNILVKNKDTGATAAIIDDEKNRAIWARKGFFPDVQKAVELKPVGAILTAPLAETTPEQEVEAQPEKKRLGRPRK
jgi:hypothetical protein